jgi:hypothetical protein
VADRLPRRRVGPAGRDPADRVVEGGAGRAGRASTPARRPDRGLSPRPILVALEVATYPYARLAKQAADYALLLYLVHGVVPEVITPIPRPRGRRPVPRELVIRSEEGTTSIRVEWKVIGLWKVPAADLLAVGDIGLIPLVPLSLLDRPLEAILDECRERIHRDAPARELGNLLSVTHFFAGLKYNDPRLFERPGGDEAMLKTGSPLIRKIIEDATEAGRREMAEKGVVDVLAARFGPEAKSVGSTPKTIAEGRLEELFSLAATCPDLASFREQIAPRGHRRRS